MFECVCITKNDPQGKQWFIKHIFDVVHCLSENPKLLDCYEDEWKPRTAEIVRFCQNFFYICSESWGWDRIRLQFFGVCYFTEVPMEIIEGNCFGRSMSFFVLEFLSWLTRKITHFSTCHVRIGIRHRGMTGVSQARKHFLTFKRTATDSESSLHSTYIHATSLPPKMMFTPPR